MKNMYSAEEILEIIKDEFGIVKEATIDDFKSINDMLRCISEAAFEEGRYYDDNRW